MEDMRQSSALKNLVGMRVAPTMFIATSNESTCIHKWCLRKINRCFQFRRHLNTRMVPHFMHARKIPPIYVKISLIIILEQNFLRRILSLRKLNRRLKGDVPMDLRQRKHTPISRTRKRSRH